MTRRFHPAIVTRVDDADMQDGATVIVQLGPQRLRPCGRPLPRWLGGAQNRAGGRGGRRSANRWLRRRDRSDTNEQLK